MIDQSFPPAAGFDVFLPAEYRGKFSREWLMGLSPFEDRTCGSCYSVQQGQWITFGPREAEERFLKCERTT